MVICLAPGVAGTQAFTSLEEQRAHARSDWHRYNVKAQATGKNPVSEAEFERLLENGKDEVRFQTYPVPHDTECTLPFSGMQACMSGVEHAASPSYFSFAMPLPFS